METGIYNEGTVTEAFASKAKLTKPVYDTGHLIIVCKKEYADVTIGGMLSFKGETRAQSDRKCVWYVTWKENTVKVLSPDRVHGVVLGIAMTMNLIPREVTLQVK